MPHHKAKSKSEIPTALAEAIVKTQVEIMRLLWELGADPEKVHILKPKGTLDREVYANGNLFGRVAVTASRRDGEEEFKVEFRPSPEIAHMFEGVS